MKKKSKDSIPPAIEKILYQLYRKTLKLKEPKKLIGDSIIHLGALEEEIETKNGTKALEYLMKKGVVKSYIDIDNEMIDREGEGWEEIVRVKCSFYPEKVINNLENLWGPKKDVSKELAEDISYLEDLIKIFFDKKTDKEERLKLNKVYENIWDSILKQLDSLQPQLTEYGDPFDPDSLLGFEKPFRSLFSADKELRERKISIDDVFANLHSYYGKSRELEDFFSVSSSLELRKMKEELKLAAESVKTGKELITMDGKGDFYYHDHETGESHLIEMNINSLYYEIMEILYKNRHKGIVPYEAIEKGLIEKGYKEIKEWQAMVKRISNAITNEGQGLHKTRVNGKIFNIINDLPDGNKIIKSVWGKGIRFRNHL